MHNCKRTRNVLIDHMMGEITPARRSEVLADIDRCAACQAEFAALENTLRVSGQALQFASPPEEFWQGYRARLRNKLQRHQDLKQSSTPSQLIGLSVTSRLWNEFWKLATTSVQVPAPAALALVVLVGILAFSALSRSREQVGIDPSAAIASMPVQTIQVPVIEERVVTRVVYVEKKTRRANASSSPGRPHLTAANLRTGPDASGKTEMSLVGFKPTDQVKLTIIKGSYQDEK